MITVDTSSLIAILLGEPIKPKIIESTRKRTLIAPHSLHWEIPNAFSAMFKRNPPRISLEQSKEALDTYEKIPIRFVEIKLQRAVEIAHYLDIYAYDAFMLAAAERYNAPLLTLDKRCKQAAETLKIPVLEIQT